MTEVDTVARKFSHFLNSSWESCEDFIDTNSFHSLRIDWLQANWEILVEGAFFESGVALEVYGEGADCNGASSRVLYPERLPSHRLVCHPAQGITVIDFLECIEINAADFPLIFDRFVSLTNGG